VEAGADQETVKDEMEIWEKARSETASGAAVETTTRAEPEAAPLRAVSRTVPEDRAVRSPEAVTVATEGASRLQTAETGAVEASENVPAAMNCREVPVSRVALEGRTETETRLGAESGTVPKRAKREAREAIGAV
jgi:hypothetical protein